jgi:DNA-binding response OmpR family regulator
MTTVPVRLLLIEDDKHVRQVLWDIIIGFGYEVEVAADGAEGLVKFRQTRFQAVITDLVMPNLNGLQVAAAIRDLDPTVPVLLLTGSADGAAVAKARQLGLTILHKPFLIPTLLAAIEAALRGE